MKKQRNPITLRTVRGTSSWAYINNASIDVYIQHAGQETVVARITEQQILKALGKKV